MDNKEKVFYSKFILDGKTVYGYSKERPLRGAEERSIVVKDGLIYISGDNHPWAEKLEEKSE